jgi:predicted unusual protein kinase regulating ubiquinone biosynthesis (AarF/ABC1/UbiB family)
LPQEFERYFFAPKTGAKPEHDASQTPIPVAGDSVAAGAFSQIFLMNETINGVRCCVKLQRPEIEKALPKLPPRVVRNRAFRAMTSHSNLSDIFNLWDSMVHDLMHQCDFQREAETQDALHKLHANDPLVFTPAVDLARSNRKMIVQEYVSDHIDIFTFGRHSQQFERNRIGEALVRWMFRSLKAGYYYPEMLPGNLLFAKGRVAIVDYGMAREVGDGVGTFVGLWTALRFGDDERIRAETMAMGFTPNSPRFDWKTYIRRLRFEYFAPLLSNHPIVIDRAFVTKMIHGQRRTDLALGCQIPEGPRAFNVFFFWNFMGILGVLGAEAPWGTVIEEVLSLGD